MAVKTIAFGPDTRDKIKNGVSKLFKAVRATFGPRGRWRPCSRAKRIAYLM